jgi:putative pyruvate formate lyase activating enzyme
MITHPGRAASLPDLAARADALLARLACCDICPHACGVDRLHGAVGRCATGARARIAAACDHHGEEPAISGTRGSGTVFAAGCNLRCVYCQNHQISQGAVGAYPEYDADALADTFLSLQAKGCHNLNWVSPTHVAPQLVAGLARAVARGFRLPVVYNTNGYDRVDVLAKLDGVVDIYLPDLKYADDAAARRLSAAPGYPDAVLAAIREMHRQVGDLVLDDDYVAVSGVIVRHLVLPHNLSGTREALRRLAEEVSPTITVSLMAQYYPTHRAAAVSELRRTLTAAEYDDALDAFADAGLENGWAQELQAEATYRPDFDAEEHPFE